MPSLSKRLWSSGRVTWDIRYWKDGRQHTFTIGETDRRTAEKTYKRFCRRLSEGRVDGKDLISRATSTHSPVPFLSELAEKTRIFAESNKSEKTKNREQNVFNNLIRVLGDISLDEVTPAKVEEYKEKRLREVGAPTINIEIRVLNTALHQGVILRWLEPSLRQSFRQIKVPESEPHEWLDNQQIDQLLSTDVTEFRNYLLFMLNTGCRRNESLGITWSDVDLEKGQIVIRGTVGKMGKRRTIPVNNTLLELLMN